MTRLIRILLPTMVLCIVARLGAEAPPVAGTLPEDLMSGLRPLLKEAVERSPPQIASSIGVAQAEANRYIQAAALWPQLSGNLSYQDNRQAIGKGVYSTVNGYYYSANLNQPVFEWGAYKNQADVAYLGKKIAERSFADVYRNLALTIRGQYMGLVAKKMTLRNARYAEALSKEALATAQARFDSGASSDAELLGFKLGLEQTTLDTDRVEDDYAYAKRVFMRLVGIDELPDDSIPDGVPHPEFSAGLADAVLTGFVGSGIESTFQSQVYQLQIQQQELNYKIAKVRLLPKVSFAASYNYQPQIAINAQRISEYGVVSDDLSLGASWSIFDGFATKGYKLSALESRRQLEEQRKSYIDSTIDAVSDMRRQLGFAARAMAIAEVHANLAEADVKKQGDDLKLGFGSQSSVENSRQNFYGMELQRTAARADFLGRWSEFISVAGIDPVISNLPQRYVR
jgi:outer membrane protein TolC